MSGSNCFKMDWLDFSTVILPFIYQAERFINRQGGRLLNSVNDLPNVASSQQSIGKT